MNKEYTIADNDYVAAVRQPASAAIQLNTFKTVKIMAKKDLRIRAGASTSSRIPGALKYGTSIVVLEDLGQWYKIKYNGVYAYIFKEYTK